MSTVPIGDHGVLSDCRCAALVTRVGSIGWLCFPRFDSPSVFARVLDDAAGHWSITAVGATDVAGHYGRDTLVPQTRLSTPKGVFLLDTGSVAPLFEREGTTILTRGGPDHLVLTGSHHFDVENNAARACMALRAGERLSAGRAWTRSGQSNGASLEPAQIAIRLEDTIAAWRSWWSGHRRGPAPRPSTRAPRWHGRARSVTEPARTLAAVAVSSSRRLREDPARRRPAEPGHVRWSAACISAPPGTLDSAWRKVAGATASLAPTRPVTEGRPT